jgi:hypothetical protein
MAVCCWDGREEDAAHKMGRDASCWLMRCTGPAPALTGAAGPMRAENAETKSSQVAETLNVRGIPTPEGGKWYATQVIRVRKRLADDGIRET